MNETLQLLAFAIFICTSAFAAELEVAAARAERIEIPRVDFRKTRLAEVCEFLSQKSLQLNPKRVNIIIAAEGAGEITLRLEKRSLLSVLQEAVAQLGGEVQEEPYALVIREKGAPKLPPVAMKKDEVEASLKELGQWIVPSVNFRDVTVYEAIDLLMNKAKSVDREGRSPFSLILQLDEQQKARRITLRCDQVPLLELYRYVAALGGLEVELAKYGLIIRPPIAKRGAR